MRAIVAIAQTILLSGLALSATAGVAAAEDYIKVIWRKAQFLPVPGEPASIIIGDPGITDVSLEGNGKIIIFGKVPGETSLTVLASNGDVLLDTAVVVTPQDERHVSVISPSATAYTERTWNCSGRCVQVVGPGTIDYKAPKAAAGSQAASASGANAAAGAAQTAGGIQTMNQDAAAGASAVAGQSNMLVTP
jgi:Flp pilus assembly secretin CpaC